MFDISNICFIFIASTAIIKKYEKVYSFTYNIIPTYWNAF